MENSISLKDFLEEYGESMAEKVTRELQIVHDPSTENEEGISDLLKELKKKPFASQEEIIKACHKSMMTGNRAVYTVCEMGTGKTLMAIAVSYILHKLNGLKRVLIICPPHLVQKWIQEIKDSLPDVKTFNLNGKDVIRQLQILKKDPQPHTPGSFLSLEENAAKTGFFMATCGGHKTKKEFLSQMWTGAS